MSNYDLMNITCYEVRSGGKRGLFSGGPSEFLTFSKEWGG